MATRFFQEWKTKPLGEILAGRIRAYYDAPGRQDPWSKEIDLAVEQKPGVLDEFAAEQAKLLNKEITELDDQASRFAEEIKELGGDGPE
jgi:hypothetical protein